MRISSSSAAPESRPPVAERGVTIVVLALLLSILPITTDLYLPVLPTLTHELGASVAASQLTLSALLLAFGCSQLVWGPLSDRYGRRPILLVGLGLYILASLASALAPSMSLLVLWRTLQGAAMGAAVVCGRAIVRDLFNPVAGARAMSKASTGLGVVACLCAPVGALLAQWLGWRTALLALTVYAVVTWAMVLRHLPETLAQPNAQALRPATLVRTWAMVLRHPTFWTYSLLTTATYGGVFSFLASSSFIFMEVLGMGRAAYSWALFFAGLCYFTGTFVCRALMARWGLQRTVAVASLLSVSGGALVWVGTTLDSQNPLAFLLPFSLFMVAHGIHQPCGQSGCVGPFPQAAGVASAFNGFMMMVVAFTLGAWLGQQLQSNGGITPLVHSVALFAGMLGVVGWVLVPRWGRPQA